MADDVLVRLDPARLLKFNGDRIAEARKATEIALNKTATLVKSGLRAKMLADFDRPTPYTLGALRIVPATEARPTATINLKSESAKGTPADNYVGPQIFGGDRRLKRAERALQAIGVMPSGTFAVPGRGADVDAYGNMSRGQIVKILSALQAFGEQGYRANRSRQQRGSLGGNEYFAVRSTRGNLRPGVYERARAGSFSAVRPLLLFVRAPKYRPRYAFYAEANRIAREQFPSIYARTLRFGARA